MSIRQYGLEVVPSGIVVNPRNGLTTNAAMIIITAPLTADAIQPNTGFITEFKVHWQPQIGEDTRPFVANLERRTWRVKQTVNGLQRVIKHSPYTTDRWYGRWYGPAESGYTKWQQRFPGKPPWSMHSRDWTKTDERHAANGFPHKWSFDVETYWSMLDGIVLGGAPAQPFVDWMTEYAEFTPWFTTAGWLPKTFAEFKRVRDEREAFEQARRAAAGLVNTETNRWR